MSGSSLKSARGSKINARRGFNARRGYVRVVAAGLIAVCGGLSVVTTSLLSASASRNQLTYTDKAEDGMKPDEALGIAAGAFRGLFINALWMRANDLKEAGKFHEAVDLARTITRLQPRFPRVWVFHAWNLAYNISVVTNTVQERWQWVNAGIRLLRDEAIPQNPSDLLLHKELAWIHLHKVQGLMDDANQYYKKQFAIEWTIVTGTPPARTDKMRDTASAIEVYTTDYIGRIERAEPTIEALYAKFPEAKTIVEELRDQQKMDVLTPSGRRTFLANLELRRSSVKQFDALAAVNPKLAEMPIDPFLALLSKNDRVESMRALIAHLRKRMLIDEYHMEPERMIRYTRKYGPLDWRHPAAHALYWAARGVEEALARVNANNAKNFDFINTDRMVVQALQEMFRNGLVMFDVNHSDRYVTMPNDYFISTYGQVITELMEREEKQYLNQYDADIRGRTFRFYAAGYENFLHDAITFLYRRGQIEDAQAYRLKLATWKGINSNDPSATIWLQQSLDQFVIWNVNERITSPNIAVQEVAASIQGALVNGLLAGDMKIYNTSMAYAERFHKAYTSEQWRTTGVDTNTARMGVMQKDFRELTAFYTALTMQYVGPTNALTIWSRLAEDQKVWTYDTWLSMNMPQQGMSKEQAAEVMKELTTIFPPPEGIEQHRKDMARKALIEEQRGTTEVK
ncbi:MAG: hypothetical protein IBJ18_09595 [Phycisphaerales bacterium]|nr:hypothetical protein [Phycisphaerales bacterium]